MSPRSIWSVLTIGLCLSTQVAHSACFPTLTASNPDTAYTTPIPDDGTVIDTRTGLMWKRCSEGQQWVGGSCTGSATTIGWSGALQLAANSTPGQLGNWRVPNIKELRSLVEECRSVPAINETIFPQVPFGSTYWSSSPARNFQQTPNLSWAIDSGNGSTLARTRNFAYSVRLVSGGDYYDNLAASNSPAVTTALLSVSAIGSGTVTSNRNSVISCAANASQLSGTCQAQFSKGNSVILTAAPGGQKPFKGWGGVCSDVGTALSCTVNMSAAQSAVALFEVVNAQAQTIGQIGFNPTPLTVGGTTTASATTSSNLHATFTSNSTTICTVSGTYGEIIQGIALGACSITANQAGDGTYSAAAPVTQSLTVIASQTISAISFAPTTLAVDGTTTASATGGASGSPVVFSSNTQGICTVSGTNGTIIKGVIAGNCFIAANQAGGENGGITYAPARELQQTLVVVKGSQTINFPPISLAAGGTATAVATGGKSTKPVTFSTTTPSVCGLSGPNNSTITAIASTGVCHMIASQLGDDNYEAASNVAQDITIKTAQTINFPPISLAVGVTTTAVATAPGGTVTFTSSTAGTCTVSGSYGSTILGVAAGSCSIIANQAGNNTYSAAPQVVQPITVAKGSQTIGVISLSTPLTVNGTSTVSAPASGAVAGAAARETVTFGVSGASSTICEMLDSTTLRAKTNGTCNLVANQAGNLNYLDAVPVVQSMPFSQSQTITFTAPPTSLAVGGTATVSATASSGLLPVTFSGGPPSICTISGITVSGITVRGEAAGTCIIYADQLGNGTTYQTAPQAKLLIAVKASQTIGEISFAPLTLAVGGMTAARAASAGASGNPVKFSTTEPPGICEVTSDGTVTVTGPGKAIGTCTIYANQAGNDTYAAAPQMTGTITVVKGDQSIGAITLSTSLTVGGTATASATASSGGTVTFIASGSCTRAGNVISGSSAGNCSLTASQTGNPNYNDISGTPQNFTVYIRQTIDPLTFQFSSTPLVVNGTTTASAMASSGGTVTFSTSSPNTVCTVSGAGQNIINGVGAGICSVVASQDGNGTYLAAPSLVKNIEVMKGNQTIGPITFTPTTLNVGATAQASATATSGLPVSFSSSVTPSICSVSGTNGKVVAGDSPGTCTITASQDGFEGNIQKYNAAPSVQKDILVTGTTVSFNPTSLTFDPQYVGTTSATKTLTLTNTGAGKLKITSIVPTLNVFAVSGNTCLSNGGNVLAGLSCTISVTFSPTEIRTRVGSITVTSNSANTTDSFTVSGQGVASNAPICTLSATPASVLPRRSSTLTANCSPAPTSYSWTGGTCAGTSAATCTVTPTLTTTYVVTGTNSFGSSMGSATVTVKPVDLTPILMLLLD